VERVANLVRRVIELHPFDDGRKIDRAHCLVQAEERHRGSDVDALQIEIAVLRGKPISVRAAEEHHHRPIAVPRGRLFEGARGDGGFVRRDQARERRVFDGVHGP
jgi:hypothetical protein